MRICNHVHDYSCTTLEVCHAHVSNRSHVHVHPTAWIVDCHCVNPIRKIATAVLVDRVLCMQYSRLVMYMYNVVVDGHRFAVCQTACMWALRKRSPTTVQKVYTVVGDAARRYNLHRRSFVFIRSGSRKQTQAERWLSVSR